MITKQIKNLTKEEIEKICDEQLLCADCPLMLSREVRLCLNDKGIKENLEKEIEVEND